MTISKQPNLPQKTASLDQAGIQKLLGLAAQDQPLAKQAAAFLTRDPAGALDYFFRLSPTQQRAIRATPAANLLGRMQPVIDQLSGGVAASAVSGALYDPGTPTDDLKCNCHIHFET